MTTPLLAATALGWAWVIEAVAVTFILGLAALALRTITVSGFVGGVIAGAVVYLTGGRAAFGLLVLFFAAGSAATAVGYRRKQALAAAQGRGGARSAANVAGKGLAAVVCAVLGWFVGRPDWARVALVASLAAALGDTVATELGTLVGDRAWSVPRLRRVPTGTPGAVSLEGSALGVAAAGVMGAVGALTGLVPWPALGVVVGAAAVAGLAESLVTPLAARHLGRRWRGPVMNLGLTLTAAGLAAGLWLLVGRS